MSSFVFYLIMYYFKQIKKKLSKILCLCLFKNYHRWEYIQTSESSGVRLTMALAEEWAINIMKTGTK